MRRGVSIGVFALCVAISVAGLVNVMADNADVIRKANAVACGDLGPECKADMTRMERTPISQTFEIVTPKRKVDVRCVRGLYFVGEYSCRLP